MLRHMISYLVAGAAMSVAVSADTFLPNWMGQVWPAIKDLTILDLSLPGTHDTMTYDLDDVVADGGLDGHDDLSKFLHDLPVAKVGEFIRPQAQSQALDIVAQLENGIRFLDFRIMKTGGDWRCLHAVQTRGKAIDYLTLAKAWMVAHPTEVVVFWFSKHGSECATGNDAYPGVSQGDKRKFWSEVETLFGNIIVDAPVNTTAIGDFVAKGQRALMYVSDYVEFTGGSPKAVDGCLLHNTGPMDPANESNSFPLVMQQLQNLTNASCNFTLAANKKANVFELASFASSQGDTVIEDNGKLHFDPAVNIMDVRRNCAGQIIIPNAQVNPWCPPTLLDFAQLGNYYNQVVIEAALENGWALPNAIYIDAVDVGGTLRTGPRRLNFSPKCAGGQCEDNPTCVDFFYTHCSTHQPTCRAGFIADGSKIHFDAYGSTGSKNGFCGLAWQNHYRCCRKEPLDQDVARFAYVDSLALYSVNVGCSKKDIPECASLRKMLQARRAMFPVKLWDDVATGRSTSWPARPWLPPLQTSIEKPTSGPPGGSNIQDFARTSHKGLQGGPKGAKESPRASKATQIDAQTASVMV